MTDDTRQDCHVHINFADCINCQHEFTVAQEPGKEWYTCPLCKTDKATLRYTYSKPEPHLQCACKNRLFHITEKNIYCPNCGATIQ